MTASPADGTAIDGMESWLGVLNAAPPVGPLRWRPPDPVAEWTAPMKANTPSCCGAQDADLGIFARADGSEDCLHLIVYRSAQAATSGQTFPVFARNHDGALQVGEGGHYEPTKSAIEGAVIVIINRRSVLRPVCQTACRKTP